MSPFLARRASSLAGLSVLVLAAAWAGVALTQETGRVAAIWIANALVIVVLLQAPRRDWAGILAAGHLGNLAANLAVGDTLMIGLGLAMINTTEVVITSMLLRRWQVTELDALTRPRGLLVFVGVAGGLGPFVSAMLASDLLHFGIGAPAREVFAEKYLADALGLVTAMPILLLLRSADLGGLFAPGRRISTLAILGGFAALLGVTFLQTTMPLLFLPLPALLFIVFRLGVAGGAVGIALIAAGAVLAIALDTGPIRLFDDELRGKVHLAQAYLAICTLMTLQVAAALAERDRLRTALTDTVRAIQSAREALAASEAAYRLIADNTTDMITRLDLDLRRTYVSPASRDLLGWTPEEFLATPFLEAVHPDDVEGVRRAREELLAGRNDRQSLTYRRRNREGRWLWLEVSARLLRDAEGRPREIVSVTRDITERLALQDQLRQSQKLEVVGQLTAGIAHDFNNLLGIILGSAEVLAEEIEEPDHRLLALQIQTSGERAADLTQKLLSFGRRQTLRPAMLDLAELTRGVATLLRRTLAPNIEVVTETEGPLAVLADRTLLESALLNLALNARDAMPEGGRLTLRTSRHPAAHHEAAFADGDTIASVSVCDTGSGILPELRDRIFEPFFTTKPVGKGSGLGLSMVHGFVKQSGGHLALDSTADRGTCFTLSFLALSPELLPAQAAAVAPELPRSAQRLLLVEDDEALRGFIATTLTRLGYQVTACATGEAAEKQLARQRFDILFTDVLLGPGINGVELADRALVIHPDLAVLITSGHPRESLANASPRIADLTFLRKPFKRQDMAEALGQSLHKRRLMPSLAR